jgi:hypothetical protein
VAAGGAFTGQILHTLEHVPAHHRQAHIVSRTNQSSSTAAPAEPASPSAGSAERATKLAIHTPPKVPSKSLGYLAVGGPPGGSHSGSPSAETDMRETSAHAASVPGPSAGAEESVAPPRASSAPPATQSGGGSSLGYLGR